jgi:hypothetical protein
VRPRVYISGPISDGGRLPPEARMVHVRHAMRVHIELARAGLAPLAPQLTETIEREIGETLEHREWLDVDMPWVLCANAVLRLPGSSVGADMECEAALEAGIPVFHSIRELVEWAKS